MKYPTSYGEYCDYFDLVPTTPAEYLRRFCSGKNRTSSPRSDSSRPQRAGVDRGGWHYAAPAATPAPTTPATARRRTSSAVVQVAGPIVEARRAAGSAGVIAGYAACFGKPSVDLGGFTETLARGAFRSSLERVGRGEHDILALAEHDHRSLLGRMSAGNLRLEEDYRGLRFELTLPGTQLAHDIRDLVGRKILRGCSFSFAVIRDSWSGELKNRRRTVHDLLCYEISICGSPAYPATSVSASRTAHRAEFWTAAYLRAIAARPTRGAAAVALTRSSESKLWR